MVLKIGKKRIDGFLLLQTISAVSIICMTVVSGVFSMLGLTGIVRTMVMALICYFPMVVTFFLRPKRFPLDSIVLVIAILAMYIFTIEVHPNFKEAVSTELWNNVISLYRGVVCYLVIRQFKEACQLKYTLLASATIIFIYSFVSSITAIQNGYWIEVIDGNIVHTDYSMTFGYYMLYAVIIFLNYAFTDKKMIYWIASLVGIIEIAMLGSRAALLSVIVYIMLYVLFVLFPTLSNRKRGLLIFGLIIIGAAVILFYRPMLEALAKLFTEIGFSSRSIERLLDGTISDDIQRALIYANTQKLISEGGLFGYGMLSDRYFRGGYCHNLFLELYLDYGYVGGTIAVALLAWIIYKMLFKCKDMEWKKLFMIFFGACITRLMVSHSFWINNEFWMMLGTFIGYITFEKVNRNEQKIGITDRMWGLDKV